MTTIIKKIKRGILSKLIKPKIVYVQNSYSQAGEDVIIDFLLKSVHISKPTYLEIGVCLPDYANNTYKFYLNGSTGVLVEADETLIPGIKNKRPTDTLLNIGVGVNNEKEADFFVFQERGLNTFNREEAENRDSIGTFKIQKTIKVPLKNINEIIAENFESYPDILSIDIEGLDLEVLQTLDNVKYPIPIICAETCTYSENHIKPKDVRISEYMNGIGYFEYADTYINTVFVHKKWFYSITENA